MLVSWTDFQYVDNEAVSLWVNTIGPYHNPQVECWFCMCPWSKDFLQETYSYYSLPFCKPEHGIETKKRSSGIGEILEGNELRNSGFKLHFKTNVDKEDVCDLTLDASTASEFELAVDRQVCFIRIKWVYHDFLTVLVWIVLGWFANVGHGGWGIERREARQDGEGLWNSFSITAQLIFLSSAHFHSSKSEYHIQSESDHWGQSDFWEPRAHWGWSEAAVHLLCGVGTHCEALCQQIQ